MAPVRAGRCAELSPEFASIDDACRLFGLGRTKLFSYIRDGRIKSVLLREPGKTTGRRLIYLQSVRDFLMEQMEGGEL